MPNHGSDGIVVGGTTGESPTLSKVEKVALFKAAVDAVGDQMTVIAGAGTYNTHESVELAQRAADSGVNGVMAVTPYYSKPPQEGLFRHFTAIADATELPMMVYNIPSRTCRLIEIETLVRLARSFSRSLQSRMRSTTSTSRAGRSRLCPTVLRSTRDPTA